MHSATTTVAQTHSPQHVDRLQLRGYHTAQTPQSQRRDAQRHCGHRSTGTARGQRNAATGNPQCGPDPAHAACCSPKTAAPSRLAYTTPLVPAHSRPRTRLKRDSLPGPSRACTPRPAARANAAGAGAERGRAAAERGNWEIGSGGRRTCGATCPPCARAVRVCLGRLPRAPPCRPVVPPAWAE